MTGSADVVERVLGRVLERLRLRLQVPGTEEDLPVSRGKHLDRPGHSSEAPSQFRRRSSQKVNHLRTVTIPPACLVYFARIWARKNIQEVVVCFGILCGQFECRHRCIGSELTYLH